MENHYWEAAFILYILWDVVKKVLIEKNSDLRRNTESTMANTLEIGHLRRELNSLLMLPKDLDEAHLKIRVMEEKLKLLRESPKRNT
jgi:hypothetical protein